MTFWEFLDRLAQRGPGWPTERGWYAIALFVQTGIILYLVATVQALRGDEFFKALANAIVITGWIGFAVGMRDNAKDRDQVGKALDVAHQAAKSTPGTAGEGALRDGDTVELQKN